MRLTDVKCEKHLLFRQIQQQLKHFTLSSDIYFISLIQNLLSKGFFTEHKVTFVFIVDVWNAQRACIKNKQVPGISCGQKSSQAGHRGSVFPLKYLATHGLCIFIPQSGFSQIWHFREK